ncbi:MAG: hypothetical protein H6811_10125 [Phycisphaeraceae bacterium]|nr:hypothetical protein [Phycisphaeraceae bacterium]
MTRLRTILLFAAVACLGPALGGCASSAGAQTTRLTTDDLIEMTEATAESLRASDLLAERSPDSPPWTVTITRVDNLSSDVIPEGERWLLMERIKDSLAIATLSREKAIRFVIPIEVLRRLKRSEDVEPGVGADRSPTHTLGATFRSLTRRGEQARADLYVVEFIITDLSTGQLAWTDSFELKRAAFGRAWD